MEQRTPNEIRNASVARFVEIASDKFDKGQDEHGECLDETVTFDRLDEEIIDMWHYTQSLRLKCLRMEQQLMYLREYWDKQHAEEITKQEEQDEMKDELLREECSEEIAEAEKDDTPTD